VYLNVILRHCIWFIMIAEGDVLLCFIALRWCLICVCFFVMQALYFCVPFREHLLEYYGNGKSIGDAEENLLTCLADLFTQVVITP
jgi:hypothetical protein